MRSNVINAIKIDDNHFETLEPITLTKSEEIIKIKLINKNNISLNKELAGLDKLSDEAYVNFEKDLK